MRQIYCAVIIAALALVGPAQAQTPVEPCIAISGGGCTPVDATHPLPVVATAGTTNLTFTATGTAPGAYAHSGANAGYIDTRGTGASGITATFTAIGNAANRTVFECSNDSTFAGGAVSGGPSAVDSRFVGQVATASPQATGIAPVVNRTYYFPIMGNFCRLAESTYSAGTDSVSIGLVYSNAGPLVVSQGDGILGAATPWLTTSGASSSSTIATTTVVSTSAENNHVLKGSAGNLYSVYAVNLTATPGYLVVLDSTSSPSDGAITPVDCAPLPASGSAQINYLPGPPPNFATGITAVVTSAATCFTKTTGVITAFIRGAIK